MSGPKVNAAGLTGSGCPPLLVVSSLTTFLPADEAPTSRECRKGDRAWRTDGAKKFQVERSTTTTARHVPRESDRYEWDYLYVSSSSPERSTTIP
eukprot:scaffold8029_cov170-Amphora_coffeaeformis.AAC.1